MKKILTIMTILLMAACVFGAGYVTSYYCSPMLMPSVEVVVEVPMSITELQAILGAKPDGIVGPETIGLWEQYSFNRYAARYMTPSGGPKGD